MTNVVMLMIMVVVVGGRFAPHDASECQYFSLFRLLGEISHPPDCFSLGSISIQLNSILFA